MMATYFHGGAEIQAGDNLQTLYLMNPNYITAAYSEGTSPNMLLLNPSSATGGAGPNGLTQGSMSHAPTHHQQQLIGIPLSGTHSEDPSRPTSSTSSLHHQHHDHHHHHQIPPTLHGLAVSRVHYNLWSPTMDQSPAQPGPITSNNASGPDVAGQMGFRRPVSGQGLSLSLSPGQRQQNSHPEVHGGADMRMSVTVAGGPASSVAANGVILGSKYLKAAQELLEEVVNVGSSDTDAREESSGVHKDKAKAAAMNDAATIGQSSSGGCAGESSSGNKKGAEISTAQRQELQMKKAKLLNMLDEVEQRYRQYHTQMQVVVSCFEQAAGIGSAKLYTSLALKTISKQFRSLKDAISSQIKATSKSLGEEDNGGGGKLDGGAGSRLRYVDHQLRQQRALQQLGMIQHNAWRPQRGLPERAVSVLRAWLFEHFLHPYPKDSDKHMLAKQTGLTRSQVSNWFINARVRLWKPMVEEMYSEEMKAQEQNGGNNSDPDTTNKTNANSSGIGISSKNEHTNSEKKSTTNNPTITHPQQEDHGTCMIQPHHQVDHQQTTNDMISSLSAMSTTSSQGFTLIGSSSDMESLIARSPKKQRSNSDMNSPSSILSMDMEMKPVEHKFGHDHLRHSSLMSSHGDGGAAGFNPYIVNDMGRFNPDHQLNPHGQYHGNGVSLTLGLPHCENLSLSGSHHQQSFIPNQGMQLGRRIDVGPDEADFCGISMGQPSHHPTNNGYESIDIQSRKRFAAQILHDFVA